jgi:hypothetical protein
MNPFLIGWYIYNIMLSGLYAPLRVPTKKDRS